MRTLIIDGLNILFIRNYIVNPSLATNGAPIGGIVGAFKSLQKLCNETKPGRVIVAWDGQGGSRKRRQQDKNYKSGRTPIRLNRSTKVMSEDEELANKIWQQTKLFEYLNHLPIIQYIFEDTEADDVIACVCNLLPDDEKVIVSSDKDFIQLCDKKTILFRTVQDEICSITSVPEIYGIHPTNMCLARSIAGDKSDSLAGIQGIALKGVAQRLTFLKEEKEYTISDVMDYCEEQKKDSKIKFWPKITESEEIIRKNYKLMQLRIPNMSLDTKERIRYVLENVEYELNKSGLERAMIKDGWGAYNFSPMFRRMTKIMKEQSS